jgi:hypothetical protein
MRSSKRKVQTKPDIVSQSAIDPLPTLEEFEAFAAQCVIRSGVRLISFSQLFEYQRSIALIASKYRGIWLVKDRQLGLTEILICWMLCRAAKNPAYAGCSFSITEKDANKLSHRVKRMPSQQRDFVWDIDSVGVRKPQGGGEMNFRPSTENATRGLESIWDLFFDESGFVQESIVSEMYASSSPSQEMVGSDARTFIVSTIPPSGRDSWFWQQGEEHNPKGIDLEEKLKIAQDGGFFNGTTIALPTIPGFCAWEDESGWCKVVIGHKAHPVYGKNPNYVNEQRVKKKLTREQAEREHNLGLPAQGGSLFSINLVPTYAIAQWQAPKLSHRYLMGIDPNFGSSGGDSFVIQVWDTTSYPIALVAQHSDNQHSTSYNRAKAAELIEQYNPAIVAIESNAGGTPIAEELARVCPRTRFELINTSEVRKRLMTDRIALALEQGDVNFPIDWEGIDQIKRFSAATRKATTGHDDQVMAWAIAFTFIDEIVTIQPTDYESAGEAIGVEDLIESIF